VWHGLRPGGELEDVAGRFCATYGIDADGAVLVRPDGHIAWRSAGAAADTVATLEYAVARALGFDPSTRRAAVAAMDASSRRCA
jgi:putative polyketide hydroxylase